MKKLILVLSLAVFHSAAFASVVDYSITEHFADGSSFVGTFTYNASTQSLNSLTGTLTQVSGPVTHLTFDRNNTGVMPSLQSDGHGGVQDIVFNGSLFGNVALYLDILAGSPTTLQNPTQNKNYYVNNDDAQSAYVNSYQIQQTSQSSTPEPAFFWLLGPGFAGLAGSAAFRRRRAGSRLR